MTAAFSLAMALQAHAHPDAVTFARVSAAVVAPAPRVAFGAGGASSAAPQPEHVDPVAQRTGDLVDVTRWLVFVTSAAIVIPAALDLHRRYVENQRSADSTDATRKQLIVSLQLYETVIARLGTSPEESVDSHLEVMRLLFERALELDVAIAILPDQRAAIYDALVLAQHTIIEARATQEELARRRAAYENERRTAEETLARGRQYASDVTGLQMRMVDEKSNRRLAELRTELARLKDEQTVYNGSPASAAARAFVRNKAALLGEIATASQAITTRAAAARTLLQTARAALEDRPVVDRATGAAERATL